MESSLPASWKKNIFSSVNSHSDNTVFFTEDYFAACVDAYFNPCFNFVTKISDGKILIYFFDAFLNYHAQVSQLSLCIEKNAKI
ncbi:MAG: hypothetical protein ACM3RX_02090 [Methanococcaceae archaeon]